MFFVWVFCCVIVFCFGFDFGFGFLGWVGVAVYVFVAIALCVLFAVVYRLLYCCDLVYLFVIVAITCDFVGCSSVDCWEFAVFTFLFALFVVVVYLCSFGLNVCCYCVWLWLYL